MEANHIARLKRLEIIGIVFVCVVGTLAHFVYEWSGENFIVGLLAPVNESVWEHTKMTYFTTLIYAVVEFAVLRPDFKRFFAAKTVALAFMTVVMIVAFYTYTGVTGMESLAVDVVCMYVWVVLGFLISFRLYTSGVELEKYFAWFCILFLGQLAMQLMFTPFTPDLPLFEEHSSGMAEIPHEH